MTRVNNPNFIGFDGEPVTGRIPPQVTVYGELTKQQAAELAHMYKLFCDTNLTMVGSFSVRNRVMQDGTRVRMESIQGRDQVYVWPVGGDEPNELPHGFAVETNWGRPRIYRRLLVAPIEWKVDPVAVPQAKTPITSSQQVFLIQVDGENPLNHPTVLNSGVDTLWDYSQRAAPDLASTPEIVPFSLEIDGKYSTGKVHYAQGNTIFDNEGAVLYSTAGSAPILLDPEAPILLPADSTCDGRRLVMQEARQAVISPIAEIWKFRFRYEELRRLTSSIYEVVTDADREIVIPYALQNTAAAADPIPDEDLSDKVFMYTSFVTGVGGSNGGAPPDRINWVTGWGYVLDNGSTTAALESQTKYVDSSAQGAGGPALEPTVVFPEVSTLHGATLRFSLNYPVTVRWHSTDKSREIVSSIYVYPPGYAGVERYRVRRYETEWEVDSTPKVEIDLGWKNLEIFGGSYYSLFVGRTHIDHKRTNHSFVFADYYYAITYTTAGLPPMGQGDPEYIPWLAANDIRDAVILPILVAYPRWTEVGEIVTTLQDTRPVNSGSYNFTSRYVIDYDHKSRFYAAIEVNVTCTAAEWREDRGVYDGFMALWSDPSYTVTIRFISNWNGVEASQTLVTGSATRPAFEFVTVPRVNVYYYGLPIGDGRDIKLRYPPMISPPGECYTQLRTLTKHQGVNPNLAAEDVRPDIAAPEKVRSKTGIEFSSIKNSVVRPHKKYVTGQLYARTFKISDFSDALWLLRKTKCDAQVNDGVGAGSGTPAWSYMPAIGAAIADNTYHIEVRDGAITTWSDNIPESGGATRPPVNDREITIFRV